MTVEYGMTVYFKTGRIWTSDPVEGSWEEAQKNADYWQNYLSTDTFKTFPIIRNQRVVMIFRDAVDCIEFFVDQVDNNADA